MSYFVVACVAGSNGSEMPGLQYNLFIYLVGSSSDSDPRWVTQHPLFQTSFFTKGSPRCSFGGFVSSERNFSNSKCSEQIWHWLSLGRFALLLRTSHSLQSGLFFKGSRWKLIPLLKSLSVLFEQPQQPQHTFDHFGANFVVFLKFASFGPWAQWRHAMRPSLQHGFQNGGCSNCSGTDGAFCCYSQVKR